MPVSTANFTPEQYGPEHKLLEALEKDSEEEWMKILRERRKDVIGWPVCVLICVLKRWTATLNMIANFRGPFFPHTPSWENSLLYKYIRNDGFITKAEFGWPKISLQRMALVIAIRDRYTEGVRPILKCVRLSNPERWFGISPLLEAVLSRNIETVRTLLDHGLRDHFVGGSNTTAAAQAAQLGELEMMWEIGWSANDDLVLERGVRGGNMDVVKTIVAARTEKFNLEHISRLTENRFIRKLLSEANAALPEGISTSTTPPERIPTSMTPPERIQTSTVSFWGWLFAKPKQSEAVSEK